MATPSNDNTPGSHQGGKSAGDKKDASKQSGTSKRGFASMDPAQQREIASEGGRAAHEKGTAHEFTPEEARRAGSQSHKNAGNRQSAAGGSAGRKSGSTSGGSGGSGSRG